MQTQTPLFDPPLDCQCTTRVTEMLFQDIAADDLHERLQEVNRTFTDVAIITRFPKVWQDRLPKAKVVDFDDVLALPQRSFDLVIHTLCLHRANDPVGQLIQSRNALRPDGMFLANLFGGETLHELRASLAEAETKVSGGLSPRVSPMGEIRDLGALLQRAGLALPVADGVQTTATYTDAFALMRDLRMMGETNSMTARNKTFVKRDLFDETDRIYKAAFALDGDRIPATFEIITLTGWAPSKDQPQPLRPGSATNRLADALGTIETPVGGPTRRGSDT
ncbi:MAG: SAM-dependent methyltransferase [Paracoccaceae bacterium]|jgi:SAM-dependent methyltransferase|nr:SAM-dependent methyltransferase [Paracoccaceae bacterium]